MSSPLPPERSPLALIQSTGRMLFKMPCNNQWLHVQEEEEEGWFSSTMCELDCDQRFMCRTTSPSQSSVESACKCKKCKKSHSKKNKYERESSKKRSRKCSISNGCKDVCCVNCTEVEVVIPSACGSECNDVVTITNCAPGCCSNTCTNERKPSSSDSSSSRKCKHQAKSEKNACSIHGCLETSDCMESTRICGCSVCHRAYNKFFAELMKRKNENAKRAQTKNHSCHKQCKNGGGGCGKRH